MEATLAVISKTPETLQVAIVALVEFTFPSKRKQIRKVSFTRHLNKVEGRWMGYGLEMTGYRMTSKGLVPDFPLVDYTEAVKKSQKHQDSEPARIRGVRSGNGTLNTLSE